MIEIPVDNAKCVRCVGAKRSAEPQKCGYVKVLGGGTKWRIAD